MEATYINYDEVRLSFLLVMIGGCIAWSAVPFGREGRAVTASYLSIKQRTANWLTWLAVPLLYFLLDVPDQIMYWIHGDVIVWQAGWPVTADTPGGVLRWRIEDQGWLVYLWMSAWAFYHFVTFSAINQSLNEGVPIEEVLQ